MSTSDLLSKLNKINEANTVLAYIPSINKKSAFRAVNVKQQKDLIGTASPNATAGVVLNQSLNKIVLENSVDKEICFSIIDRYPVILALRGLINDKIQAGDNNFIDIQNHLKEKENNKIDVDMTAQVIEPAAGVSISLAIPSIKKDSEINEALIKIIKSSKDENFGEIISNLFIYEIIKFIENISVGDDVYNFNDFTINERIKLVESLPVSINSKIMQYMEEVRGVENMFIETEFGSIEIDATFFTAT